MVICICSINLFSQEGATAKFTRYDIKGMGTIDIPAKLELRSDESLIYNLTQVQKDYYDIDYNGEIVFQTYGLNELKKEREKKYGRIIIYITNLEEDCHFTTKSKFAKEDLKAVDDSFRDEINEWESNGGFEIKIKSINKSKAITINGNNYIVYSYTGVGNGSPISVTVYNLFNKTKYYKITTSYRLSEESYWKEDFEKAIKSITIK